MNSSTEKSFIATIYQCFVVTFTFLENNSLQTVSTEKKINNPNLAQIIKSKSS